MGATGFRAREQRLPKHFDSEMTPTQSLYTTQEAAGFDVKPAGFVVVALLHSNFSLLYTTNFLFRIEWFLCTVVC